MLNPSGPPQEAERKWGEERKRLGEQLRLAVVKGEKGKQRLLAEVRRTGRMAIRDAR